MFSLSTVCALYCCCRSREEEKAAVRGCESNKKEEFFLGLRVSHNRARMLTDESVCVCVCATMMMMYSSCRGRHGNDNGLNTLLKMRMFGSMFAAKRE